MRPQGPLLSPVRRVMLAALLMDFCISGVGLGVQYLGVYRLNAPNLALGMFGTVGALAYAIGCLVSGRISDRYGRRRCIVAGCVGVGVVWVAMPNLGTWKHLLCIIPLAGIAISLFWPAAQAWLADLSANGRRSLARNIGLFNVLWCSGLMLGPIVMANLWPVSHLLTFYIPAALSVAMIAIVLLTPRAAEPHNDEPAPNDNEPHENADFFLRLAWIGNFASWFAGRTMGTMFPKLGDSLRFTDRQIGPLVSSYHAGQLLMFIYTRYEHRWQYRLWPLIAAQMAAAVGMVVAVFAVSKSLFAVGFALAGICGGMTYVCSLFYSLHGRERDRGKTTGLHEAVLGSGACLGPLLGGLSAQFINLRAPFAVAACVFAVACVSQLWIWRRARRRLPEIRGPSES